MNGIFLLNNHINRLIKRINRLSNGINRLINSITRLINGLIRLINGWGRSRSPWKPGTRGRAGPGLGMGTGALPQALGYLAGPPSHQLAE